jgi:hypothetical protein
MDSFAEYLKTGETLRSQATSSTAETKAPRLSTAKKVEVIVSEAERKLTEQPRWRIVFTFLDDLIKSLPEKNEYAVTRNLSIVVTDAHMNLNDMSLLEKNLQKVVTGRVLTSIMDAFVLIGKVSGRVKTEPLLALMSNSYLRHRFMDLIGVCYSLKRSDFKGIPFKTIDYWIGSRRTMLREFSNLEPKVLEGDVLRVVREDESVDNLIWE